MYEFVYYGQINIVIVIVIVNFAMTDTSIYNEQHLLPFAITNMSLLWISYQLPWPIFDLGHDLLSISHIDFQTHSRMATMSYVQI